MTERKTDTGAESVAAPRKVLWAFPGTETVMVGGELSGYKTEYRPVQGMTLRDYFAAAALPMFTEMLTGFLEHAEIHGLNLCDVVAKASYNYADAMLRRRSA